MKPDNVSNGRSMVNKIENLVFEGGGILGIAYLGVLDYLYKNNLMNTVKRLAGTSAGAITACIVSLRLPFINIKAIADTMDYRKIADKGNDHFLDFIPEGLKNEIEKLLGSLDCLYRLVNSYGWFTSDYFYQWISDVIASQFDASLKKPPYTFADFRNPGIHKNKREFCDLYITGTDISNRIYRVFSYETTPDMEVAQAVRISMSIPLFFEAIKTDDVSTDGAMNVFSDGGILNNYPLTIFDSPRFGSNFISGANMDTLGVRFNNKSKYYETNNLLDYILNLSLSILSVQQEMNNSNESIKARSVIINNSEISPVDFNVTVNDKTYMLLYTKGYEAAAQYFKK